MNTRIEALLGEIRNLESQLLEESKRKQHEFCYRMHDRKVHFSEEARGRHQLLRQSVHSYLLKSRFLVILTGPIIWMGLVPILLVDVVGTIYQTICFPIYGIPKVRRADYIAFDRHRLSYLNPIEKLNCEYCAYANGIPVYFTGVAARTEQHWCPIKHAGCLKCAHSRYRHFTEFGDGEGYRSRLEEIRREFDDLETPEDPA
ncbi:MAG: hypothetical protein V4689_02325 [Verrucomicrobiota bacterium]